ncbi:MAG: hypothetical protein H5T63_04965 [Chloroflexi bacterium]|nr:hypothetical protein [Chloroflexota bacterium]
MRLESEEQELLNSYERDEWQSVDQLQEESQRYQAYAISALEAKGLVSIVLPQEDIAAIRRKAAAAGMTYQAFIANLVRQYLAGNLVQKSGSA